MREELYHAKAKLDRLLALLDKADDTPFGQIAFRPIDHQSTLGAFVGKTAVVDGKGVMVDFVYRDGAGYLPSDDEVKKLRPQE